MIRNSWIDSLKGIAICGVIMIHSGGSSLPAPIGIWGTLGRNGVQLFFILSSILTFSSLEKLYSNNRIVKLKNIRWILKKFLNLIPLYYLAIFLYIIIIGGCPYWYGEEGHITIFNILAHLTFTHGLFPHYTDSIIGIEWYLGVLAIFYVVAPILYKFVNSFEKSIVFTVGSIVLCYFINYYSNCWIPETSDAYIYSTYFGTFWFFAQLLVLALGINTFYILKFDMSGLTEKKLISFGMLIFALIMIWGQANDANSLYLMSSDTIFGVWCVIIIISQSIRNTALIDNGLFRTLGRYSYPIYLFHYLIINIYSKYVNFDVGIMTISWFIQYIIVIGVSLLVAFVMEKFIDAPLKKAINLRFIEKG